MNLRKIILYITLIFFFILMYLILNNYTVLTELAKANNQSMSEFLNGNINSLYVWLQFPLLILISLLLIYLTWWDNSLTESVIRLQNKAPKN